MNEDAELDFFYSVLTNQPITKDYARKIREHTFGNSCVDSVDVGGEAETEISPELMRRLIDALLS